jgi:hypothetical protein
MKWDVGGGDGPRGPDLLVVEVLLHRPVSVLDLAHIALLVALQPRLDRLVLRVEVGHVRHEVLDDEHVRERVDLGLGRCGVDAREAGQRVGPVDVHRARSADPLATRAPERQRRVQLVLDLEQRIQHHRPCGAGASAAPRRADAAGFAVEHSQRPRL